MQRSRSPASSCCTAFGRDSSNCDVSAFKIELHLQSGTQCFEPEPALRSKGCLLVLVICTRAAGPNFGPKRLDTRLSRTGSTAIGSGLTHLQIGTYWNRAAQ